MPIPLLVPVLLALGLAASSDAGEDGEESARWTFDIPEDAFFEVNSYSRDGRISVDFENRRVAATTPAPGRGPNPSKNEVHIAVTERYVGSSVRAAFDERTLELIREGLRASDLDSFDAEEMVLDAWRTRVDSSVMPMFITPSEFVEVSIEAMGSVNALASILKRGLGFLYLDDRYRVTCSREEAENELIDAVDSILGQVNDCVWSSSRTPDSEENELKRLLGVPARGLRITFEYGMGPSDLKFQSDMPELEYVGESQNGREVWDLLFL